MYEIIIIYFLIIIIIIALIKSIIKSYNIAIVV